MPQSQSMMQRVVLAGALLLAAMNLPALAGDDGAPLFRLSGAEYSRDDLPAWLRLALYDAEISGYRQRRDLVDAALFELYLQTEAERLGKTPQQIAAQRLALDAPDDAALRKFYDDNRERMSLPFSKMRGRIQDHLHQQALRQAKRALVEEFKARGGFEALFEEPAAPVVAIASGEFPSRGPADAKVTVVEFADYQCPQCREAGAALKRLAERYPNQVRFVYMDFPVNQSAVSRRVAEGAACADRQGQFWPFHDLAFERQQRLAPNAPFELAHKLKLDEAAFKRCMNAKEIKEKVARSAAEAQRLGLQSTPTLFVNGRRVVIEQGWEEDVKRAIDEALQAG